MSILTLLARGTAVVGAAAGMLRADLLNPLAPDPTTQSQRVPLRPPETGSITFERPRPRPAFQWTSGDRVVLLGDSVLRRESELGYLETRLVIQNPDRDFQVRPLTWLTNHPLAGMAASDPDWVAAIQKELAPLKPTVIGIAFGNDLVERDTPAVESFQTNLARLLDGLGEVPASNRPRLILFSPVGRLKPADGDSAGQKDEQFREKFTAAVERLATDRNAEFVNLFAWVRSTEDFLRRVAGDGTNRFPNLFDEQGHLSAFGYYRATLALERSLRWRSSNWRFGYMRDGSLREGGFGTRILDRSRTDQSVRVRHQEELLPTPNPEGFVDRTESTRPHCYIQGRGLAPGMYALRVDGREVQRAADYDWGRYQLVTDGPSWSQSENLRQLIVKKNALFVRRWGSGGEARTTGGANAEVQPFNDPLVAELEREIAKTRKPVARLYELVRVGDAPPTETLLQIPGNQRSSETRAPSP
jgi:hypothetical protein